MSRVLPILFNTDMVRAILDGRKTVTRRLIKPQPKFKLCYTFAGKGNGTFGYPDKNVYKYWGEEFRLPDCISYEDMQFRWNPPYHADDILYIRETWHKYKKRVGNGEGCHIAEFYGYKASIANSEDANEPWKPSIHMPKEATRIWLKVNEVRVESLQDITIDGIRNEGLTSMAVHAGDTEIALSEWKNLWNSTIKKSDLDRYGWDANPWVWVIEFERCEKPENF